MAQAAAAKKERDVLEFAAGSSPHRVDRDKGIIHGVKILGRESKNGGRYSPEAVRAAVPLYDSASVFVNHPHLSRAEEERGFGDQFGWLESPAEKDGEIYGDLHYIKSHPLAGQVTELAERKPTKFGLSHNARVSESMRGGELVYESINRVRSVDLVCNPATTRGIFESEQTMDGTSPDVMAPEPAPVASSDLTWETFSAKAKEIFDGEGEAGDKAKKIGGLVKALLKIAEEVEAATSDKPKEGGGGEGGKPAEVTESVRVMKAIDVLESVKVAPTKARIKAVAAMGNEADMKAVAESWKGLDAAPAAPGNKPRSTPASGTNVLEGQTGGDKSKASQWDDPDVAARRLMSR